MTASVPVPVNRSARSAAAPRHLTGAFAVLQHEIDRLFDDVARSSWSPFAAAGAAVRMDLADTKDGIELTAELPGLEEKDVHVSLSDNLLTVSGEKRSEKEEKDKNYHFVERSYGSFSRSIELPSDIEADKIKAVISNGVLKVTAPRTAKAAPKTIEVKGAA